MSIRQIDIIADLNQAFEALNQQYTYLADAQVALKATLCAAGKLAELCRVLSLLAENQKGGSQ